MLVVKNVKKTSIRSNAQLPETWPSVLYCRTPLAVFSGLLMLKLGGAMFATSISIVVFDNTALPRTHIIRKTAKRNFITRKIFPQNSSLDSSKSSGISLNSSHSDVGKSLE